VDRLSRFTPGLKVFKQMEKTGLYETAMLVKDYLIDEIMNGRLGRVVVVYSWPKSFEIQKPRVLKLMPCDDLLSKQAQMDTLFKNVIEESNPEEIIGYLATLWITTRLYEIFMDTMISSAGALAKFLEDSVDKMKKEQTKAKNKYRKAKKSDIDKSLRETFSARMLAAK